MTRVAGANPRIWVDIFLDNAGGARARRWPSTAAGSSSSSRRSPPATRGFLARWIAEASGEPPPDARRGLPRPRRAPARDRVHVPDRPGVLAGITQALGAERINIEDFELQPLLARARRHADACSSPASGEAERRRAAARGAGLRRRRSRRCSRMRIEPAASVQGGVAVPGDKSISHRAVLLGAIADGETVIAGFGRSGRHRVDDRRRARARRRGGARTATPCASRASGLRGLRAPDGPIDCGNAGTLAAARSPGSSPARTAALRARRRRVALARGRWARIAEPLTRMGATVETTDGRAPAARSTAARLRRDPLRAAGRERAGEVVRAARRAATPRTGRRPSSSRSRRATTPSGCCAAAGARVARRAGPGRGAGRSSGSSRSGSTCPATSPRRRRSSSPRRCSPARVFGSHGVERQPDAHRPAGRARADGRADRALQPHRRGRRAGRRHRGRARRAGRDRDRPGRGAAAGRRAAAVRARGGDGPRRERRPRRGGAARRRRPTGSRR